VRTLAISDVHLGQRGGVSVLTGQGRSRRCSNALDSYDRLVLLGDTVELQETHSSLSFPVAEPILRAIAARLGPQKQLLLCARQPRPRAWLRDWGARAGTGARA